MFVLGGSRRGPRLDVRRRGRRRVGGGVRIEVKRDHEAPGPWPPTGVTLTLGAWRIVAEDVHRNRSGQTAIVSVRWGEELCYREHLNLDRARPRQQFVANLLRTCRPPLRGRARQVTEAVLIQLGEACRPRREPPPAAARGGSAGPKTPVADRRVRALLKDRLLLQQVGRAMAANGYAGDWRIPQLAYVALTSRVLERPMNLAFVAAPAAGKNATIEAALALVPPEAVYVFTAGSPTALLYAPEDLRHRVVVFQEADSIPDHGPAASAIRSLADGHALQYAVTMLNRPTGQFETRTITKAGPTGLLTTSTRPLRPQLNTRVLPVLVPTDLGLTRAVLLTKAQQAAGDAPPPPDLEPFRALQHWLAHAGEHRVLVPFAEQLAEVIFRRTLSDVRMRRDFEQLLSCVKTLAVLHQAQRTRAPGGEIVATIADYQMAYSLLAPSFDAAAAEGPTRAIRETVLAISEYERNVSETELARRLELTKQAISWRVTRAVAAGWLVNAEPRSGKPYRLRRGAHLPWAAPPLPDWRDVEAPVPDVPDPGWTARFFGFATTLMGEWPAGVTVAEWVAGRKVDSAGRPLDVGALRARFKALRRAGLLDHNSQTDRYAVSAAVRQKVDDVQRPPPAGGP